jgi:lipid II:glycine glycyltransferase (peptidoglycan interpeptide bridge formation enzyme)
MILELEKKEINDVYDSPIVQQTSYWSFLKDKLGIQSFAYEYKVRNREIYLDVGGYTCTNSDILVFLQYLNPYNYIVYLPYGPEIEPSEELQGVFIEELSESLRPYLPKGCLFIRYDLNWRSHWSKETDFDNKGRWLGAPEKKYQEFKLNYDTKNFNLRKANSDILPANTIIVDISKSEMEILARMKPKTRYNIGLAERKGVEVRIGTISDLDVWYKLYLETAQRNRLNVNDIRYFYSVFEAKMDNNDISTQVKLLIAYSGDIPLAAMFLIISSHRATYLYGASTVRKRNIMPTYALQWKAIQIAKQFGCTEYDMFGIAPEADPSHPMYGLYKFKLGFGGDVYHQLGCWDYPLDKEKYNYIQATELNSKGYYM